uniref:Uncharacterized protein LOC114348119 n=1 Tax=Diabrotica virgifera virgifera TaxID=50390 RepID=A0A6P7GXT4_DIAVI
MNQIVMRKQKMGLGESDEAEQEFLDETATLKPVNEEDIKQGSFIVATFMRGKHGTTAFRYIVIKNFDDPKDEIEVVGLRSVDIDKDKKSFVVNEKDSSFIRMSQIIEY